MKLIQDLGTRKNDKGITKRYGIYECSDCLKHFEALTETVTHRNQERCNSCASKLKNLKHGMNNHILNTIINNMIQRCTNPKTDFYYLYGGKGISVCYEWTNDRKTFFDWALANGWEEGLSIDRIDSNGNYEPSNCRWTNNFIQAQNTVAIRATNTSGFRGVSKHANKWQARIGVNGKYIHLGTFPTAEEASEAFIAYVKENNLEHKYE
jgi:DNA-directed RNA polymerase subunit RPC12/RpoP